MEEIDRLRYEGDAIEERERSVEAQRDDRGIDLVGEPQAPGGRARQAGGAVPRDASVRVHLAGRPRIRSVPARSGSIAPTTGLRPRTWRSSSKRGWWRGSRARAQALRRTLHWNRKRSPPGACDRRCGRRAGAPTCAVSVSTSEPWAREDEFRTAVPGTATPAAYTRPAVVKSEEALIDWVDRSVRLRISTGDLQFGEQNTTCIWADASQSTTTRKVDGVRFCWLRTTSHPNEAS